MADDNFKCNSQEIKTFVKSERKKNLTHILNIEKFKNRQSHYVCSL